MTIAESFPWIARARWPRYLLAAVFALLTVWVRIEIATGLAGPAFILFTVPIIFSAYLGGFGPGLLAAVTSALAACYYLLPPLRSFTVASSTQRWQLVILLLTGTLISVICEALRRARERAEGAQTVAERGRVELLAALQANRDSDELFSKAFRLGPDCMLISRLSDRSIIRANDALARLWGTTPGELAGRLSNEHVVWGDAAARAEFLRRLEEQGECLDWEAVLKMAGGRQAEFNISSRLITLKGEKCILTVLRDIAERRRLEATTVAITAIVESSDDAIIGKTLGGIVTSWNPSAERIFGYTATEMIGRPISVLVPPERCDEEAGIMARIAQGEHVRHFATMRRTKSGRTVDISVTVSPIRDLHGRVVGASKIARDITEHNQAERTLRATRERLRSTLAAGSIGTWTWDIAADRLAADEFTARAFGIEVDAAAKGLPAAAYLQAVVEEDRAAVAEALGKAIQSCGHYDIEYRVRQKDGTLLWLQARGRVEGGAEGKAASFHGAVMDITVRKEAEAAVRGSEERYRTLFEYAPDGILIADDKSYYLDANARACKMLGYTKDELVGLHATNIVSPLEAAHVDPALDLIKGGSDYRRVWQFRRKDGTGFAAEVIATVMPDGKLLAMLRDITEQRAAEERLRASTKEVLDLKAALDEHAIVAITDARGKITYVNDKFCAISQYSRPELIGQDHRIINSAHHPKEFIRDLWTTIATGRVWHGEIKNRAKDGSSYWVDTTIVPFLDEAGKPRQYIAIRADITERKRAEEKLRATAKEVLDLTTALDEHAIVAITNPQGKITFVNDRFCAISKYSREELLGQDHRIINSGQHPQEFIRDLWTTIARGRVWRGEINNRAKDGSGYWVDTTIVPFLGDDGKPRQYVAIRADITERKQAQEKIRELNAALEQRVVERTSQLELANKELEAFSYSVSHDLRAPLRAVDGFSLAVLEDFGAKLPPEGQRQLLTIRKSAQRMGELIDDLLTFSRLSRQPLARRTVNTMALAQSALADLIPATAGRQVEIRLADLPPCQGDAALLQQVWINLLSNALKYSRNRSPAIVEIGCEKQAAEQIFFVRDNGSGFDMRYAGKLFTVFQRLHRAEDYEGTGVGLAIVHRIVQRHGGRIWADAAVDRGATFYFTLTGDLKL